MIKGIKISTKISVLVILISLVAVGAVSLFTYDYNLKTNREKITNNLNVITENRASQINLFFDKVAYGLTSMQGSEQIKNGGTATPAAPAMDFGFDMGAPSDSAAAPTGSPLDGYLESQKDMLGAEQLYVTTKTGAISASTDSKLKSGKTLLDPDGSSFDKGSNGLHFSAVFKDSLDYFLFALVPLDSGKKLLVARIKLNDLYKKTVLDYRGLGQTGEVILAKQDLNSKKVILASPLRGEPNAPVRQHDPSEKSIVVFSTAFEGEEGVGSGPDYTNTTALYVWTNLHQPGWALIGKISQEEADGQATDVAKIFIYAGLCIAALATLLSMVLARSLTRPLHSMRNTLGMVADGILPENSEVSTRDEFGQMQEKVNDLVQSLKNNAQFAQRIGEGKYDTAFKPASENDLLGMSLLNMRKNLIENERRDKERNWIVRGVAEISEILRMHDTIDTLGEDVIKFILEKINAIQGAFYVVNGEGKDKIIEMRASYAYGRKKYLQLKFKFAEGLVGQAAIEQSTVLRTEIPAEYVTITSGILGEQRPTCIVVVPLITNEEVFGVLEFAGFKKFDSSQVKFVEELSLILARTIYNIKVNERTRKLLEESQEMSAELKEKQEVLRQNAEEMQATQEELTRTNQRLEEQIEEVNRTQKRMQLLLENASEVITIYEEDETIRYISPSVETILGYGQKEIIGDRDIENVHPDHREIFNNLFEKMRQNPDEKATAQFEYKTKHSGYIWIEAAGTNCMSNPAIHGYILNSRDITEKRRAEQEQRMRSKMQALSENSPDLITRLEHEAISYINPVIEEFTGKNPAAFLNKNVKEVDLDKSILDHWLRIVEEVNQSNNTISTEMDFPTEGGKRIMQVNAIPEYDESNKIESVLVVSHDITERKEIELEIQNKNKKITESINYAKRIQNAILPNNRVIARVLPDSFILYKPKDVVSGDFPWFMQVKDDIYIAAVDCTGHGVPGALLSLIGYFLLNDIVRSRKITEPGIILDLLDEGVTSTLRQDEDATTKDGMDIALCKINMNTREVEYAGAHRPLYVMKAGVLDEIKGNKFPIGGGIFKNQTNFTNTKIKLDKGDSIYFSSDGFPDQFGGPEVRKFGPKKTRETIERVHKLPMLEASAIFDQEWEDWRGETKQIDDVLLIGIKF
ncbi:MAG: PAS domain S-box protein [Cyclobacteriaceae bacterium]